SPPRPRAARCIARARQKSSKKFFIFNLTTRAFVFRLLTFVRGRLRPSAREDVPAFAVHEHSQSPDQRAARYVDFLQGMAAGSGAPHADEQSGPSRRGTARRS